MLLRRSRDIDHQISFTQLLLLPDQVKLLLLPLYCPILDFIIKLSSLLAIVRPVRLQRAGLEIDCSRAPIILDLRFSDRPLDFQ